MSEIEHEWTILHRRDWGHKHDSLVAEGASAPEPDENQDGGPHGSGS